MKIDLKELFEKVKEAVKEVAKEDFEELPPAAEKTPEDLA